MLFSLAVTEWEGHQREGSKNERVKVEFLDVSRAFLHSEAIRIVSVKLPGKLTKNECAAY